MKSGLVKFLKPTFLVLGTYEEFQRLAQLFNVENLDDNKLLELLNVEEATLVLRSASRTSFVVNECIIKWEVSHKSSKRYASLLDGLCGSNCPSHAYLDMEVSSDWEVICSRDEYEYDIIK